MAVGAKIAKTADRKKVMDTTKSTDCPKCGKATRIVKRVKDRERGIPGGVYISCSACEFLKKLKPKSGKNFGVFLFQGAGAGVKFPPAPVFLVRFTRNS